jgi:hypothetical protein
VWVGEQANNLEISGIKVEGHNLDMLLEYSLGEQHANIGLLTNRPATRSTTTSGTESAEAYIKRSDKDLIIQAGAANVLLSLPVRDREAERQYEAGSAACATASDLSRSTDQPVDSFFDHFYLF